MTRDQLHACTKKTLIQMARQKGILGWHGMTKDQLVLALTRSHSSKAAVPPVQPTKSARFIKAAKAVKDALNGTTPPTKPTVNGRARRHPVQAAAARNTSATPEEQVESSKFDVGVPTRDLSVKVPKD